MEILWVEVIFYLLAKLLLTYFSLFPIDFYFASYNYSD